MDGAGPRQRAHHVGGPAAGGHADHHVARGEPERVEVEGCIVYRGINAHGSAGELHEIDLDSYVQFNRPLDRLFTGQIDKNQRFSLRALSTLGLSFSSFDIRTSRTNCRSLGTKSFS